MKQLLAIAVLLLTSVIAQADDFAAVCADRAAIERVYHAHRTGTKQAFEQAMPPAVLERIVRADLRAEAVLRKTYAVEITPGLLDAEVARINTTTRAPEVLTEIKHALGDDAQRFVRSMARPILVERELRSRFDNDDRLHAEKRRVADASRTALLAGQPVAGMEEVTWLLTPRPAEEKATAAQSSPAAVPTQGAAKSASYSVEATAQVAQTLPAPEKERKQHYFSDLDPQMQNVLRAQLAKAGDVSAVIELSAGFFIYQAREHTSTALRAASLSIPKRSYEEWLAQQPE